MAEADGQVVDQAGGDAGSVDPQIEERARAVGWVPKEEFRGDETRWVDAQAFLHRAEEVMPILRKNNVELHSKLSATEQRLQRIAEENETMRKTLGALEAARNEDLETRGEEARQSLLREIKAAREADDIDAELDATDRLTRLNAAERPSGGEGERGLDRGAGGDAGERRFVMPPETQQLMRDWLAENPWTAKPSMIAFADGVAKEILDEHRANGTTAPKGREFLDLVTSRVEKAFNLRRPAASNVEGPRGGSGSQPRGSRFADLPAEAKAQAHKEASRRVGKGKRYETMAQWENRFAELYFSQGPRQ